MTLINHLICKNEITDLMIENELYEICDRVHASCDSDCPIYKEGLVSLGDNSGCQYFKNGKKMLAALRKHWGIK